MEAHSLYELNEYIRRVIALNFREPIWIKAEANQVKQSRNNFYLNLVEKEKGKDKIIAEANGVLWARNYFFLKKKLGEVIDQILVDGTEMLIKVKVDFNERYGLKLQIEDIDPAYTFGQTEIRRQEIIERIKKESLHELNSQFPLPSVIQKVAVLSSKTAAGFQDFKNQLSYNTYGYEYQIELYDIPVQGALLESKFLKALEDINSRSGEYDMVVIVRGGGSKLDLSWFDTYPIAKAIAEAELPVLTGIGHDIDFSIADMVAHTDLKTPTAVADFLIDHNLKFESYLLDLAQSIGISAQEKVQLHALEIEKISYEIFARAQNLYHRSESQVSIAFQSIMNLTEYKFSYEMNTLESKEILLENLEPQNVLRRGYAVIYKGKKSISKSEDIQKGEQFEVKLLDGTIHSERIK